jgi:bacillithiol biosynthesis cysteine-adding enzyme BshC
VHCLRPQGKPVIRIDLRQLPGTSAVLRDYVHHFAALAPFFAREPRDPEAFQAEAAARSRRAYPRRELVEILGEQNAAWGAPRAVQAHLQELGQSDAVAVLTGQQTGLFGGPLYTLYKALTALALARRLRATLGRPVVPLFWLAAEDHDVAEVDHVQLPDRSGAPLTLRFEDWETPRGFLPANLRLGPGIAATLEEVRAHLPSTEFVPWLSEALVHAYAPGRTLADAFARWMTALLGEDGLVLVNPADPRLKRLTAGLLRQELAEAPASAQRILETSEQLRARGYPAQIEARPDAVNYFLLSGGRRPLVREPGGFRLRDSGELIPAATLQRRAEEAPEEFSPNVALRPVVQDALFPTLGYVAGPSELAYFAQLRPVYEQFGVPMPLLLPRAFLTLAEPRILQLLERFHLALPDLTLEPEQLSSRVLHALLPPDVEATLAKARDEVSQIFQGVGEAVAAVDPTLRATVGQTAGHIRGHLDQLERKAVQALKRREADTRQQVLRLCQALMPGGRLQERVFPALPYLAKYGPALLETLRQTIDGPGWDHRLVSLGG